jgi:hypothetical protein
MSKDVQKVRFLNLERDIFGAHLHISITIRIDSIKIDIKTLSRLQGAIISDATIFFHIFNQKPHKIVTSRHTFFSTKNLTPNNTLNISNPAALLKNNIFGHSQFIVKGKPQHS